MFGKLLKHELLSFGRVQIGLYLGMLVSAVVFGFVILSQIHQVIGKVALNQIDDSQFENSLVTVLPIIFVFVQSLIFLVALVITLISISRRFTKNIFGRQGYLTLTLPVSTHQLIWVKTLVSVIHFILTFLAFYASLLIVLAIVSAGVPSGSQIFSESIQNFFSPQTFDPLDLISECIQVFKFVLGIFAAASLAHLAKGYRGLLQFTYFIVLTVGIYLVLGLIHPQAFSSYSSLSPYYIVTLLSNVLQGALFYWISYYILSKHVNLD